jgi:hypothetical protein
MIDMHSLIIDNRIYQTEIIKRAISDYDDIAKITLSTGADTTKSMLQFEQLITDFELIKNEFCNYLIQLHAVTGEGSEQLY